MERVQTQAILADLKKKMVFLSGPRQSGKTTIAKCIMREYQEPVYFNYDQVLDRKIIEDQAWLGKADLLVLDELHKMPNWKQFLKGVFDTKPEHQHILVTGSARLEIFTEVGDSLAGRFFLHRLLPLSLSELRQIGEPLDFDRLMIQGNFPEPYLAEPVDAGRWRLQYIDSLLRTDVLDFERIDHVRAIRLVFELLRTRVGSPISYQSIAVDVGISPNTVKKYISILEALYIVFRVSPYHKNIARSLLKESKFYFYDLALVKNNEGIVLENAVANALLKHCYALEDYQAKAYKLQYLRTKEGKEVDFALALDGEITQLIEVKNRDTALSKTLQYFVDRYDFEAVQLVRYCDRDFQKGKIAVLRLPNFLKALYL
jgi:uncharacterized protein